MCCRGIVGVDAVTQDLVEFARHAGLLVDPMAVVAQHLDALDAALDVLLDPAVDGAGRRRVYRAARRRLLGRGELIAALLGLGLAPRQRRGSGRRR